MTRLTLLASANALTGYGQHAIQIIRGLDKLGIYVSLRPLNVIPSRMGAELPDDIRARIVRQVQPEEWEILLAPPHHLPTPGKKTLYFTMFEATRLPMKSVEFLNRAEVVVVPCHWCKENFEASGVTAPIRIVPLGVDPEIFKPTPMRMDGPCVFGTAGRLAHGKARKGVREVIEAFKVAFKNGEHVELHVKVHPDCDIGVVNDPRIKVTAKHLTEKQVANWITGLTCFASGATGEGWGLWQHQALACGRPIIAAQYGGLREFFGEGMGWPVEFEEVPATEEYFRMGNWAKLNLNSMVEAMLECWSVHNQSDAIDCFRPRNKVAMRLTWENSIDSLLKVLNDIPVPCVGSLPLVRTAAPAKDYFTPDFSRVNPKALDDLTVCITSFQRETHLIRAVRSCLEAGVKNIVVFGMSPNFPPCAVESAFPEVKFCWMEADLGCNELWLQAAYQATTKHVLILHDDDYLDSEFSKFYESPISVALDDGYAVTWRGAHARDDGTVTPTEYWHGQTRLLPISELEQFLLRDGLSLSPIVTVFNRKVLIHALKEACEKLTHYLHPGMLLGTEVLAHLRQQQGKKGWLYIDNVLSYYGVHDGSGTFNAEKSGDLSVLRAGYNQARKYFTTASKPILAPRILFVFSDYDPVSADDKRRIIHASETWQFHFDQGTMIPFPVRGEHLARTSEGIGDEKCVPYFKDLIDFGMRHAQPEDIVVIANRDILLTTMAADRIIAGVIMGGGVSVAIRRSWPYPPDGKLRRSVLNCVPDGGYDLFAITPAWWKQHGHEMPDMLIGREAFDTVFRTIAEEVASKSNKCAYMDDVTHHESHISFWQKERFTNAGQCHNRKLGLEFFIKRKNEWLIKQLKQPLL